ncbi:MAG TPA: hypothetical protein PLK94_10675 [Alphaproteobacteria bacterium]|nr:hypothetical protein [Alphaproteobacteria bacterium]
MSEQHDRVERYYTSPDKTIVLIFQDVSYSSEKLKEIARDAQIIFYWGKDFVPDSEYVSPNSEEEYWAEMISDIKRLRSFLRQKFAYPTQAVEPLIGVTPDQKQLSCLLSFPVKSMYDTIHVEDGRTFLAGGDLGGGHSERQKSYLREDFNAVVEDMYKAREQQGRHLERYQAYIANKRENPDNPAVK